MTAEDMTLEIARRVRDAGGRVLLVGGYVRDRLMGIASKDIDIEVYGITPAALRALLSALGEPYDKGAAFCVLGLRHYDLDIAMPRRESRTGLRHTDFDVSVDPFLSYEEASRRRDFTINAMMLDPLTGEVIDCWGGQEDLRRRVIRHVSDETFGDDPLRVFRAAQFAARLIARIAPETVAISRTLDVTHLSCERVWEELSKALLKADRPSVFFRALREMGQLAPFFPEIDELPGELFGAAMRRVDTAARFRGEAAEGLNFMLSMLLSPLPGGEEDGAARALTQVGRLTTAVRARRYVQNMLALQDRPGALFRAQAAPLETRLLFDGSLCPRDLALMGVALSGDDERDAARAYLLERVADYEARLAQPMLTGRDLMAAGYPADARMKERLAYARRLHFDDRAPEAALEAVRARFPLDAPGGQIG